MKTPWWFMHKTPVSILLLPVSVLYWFVSRIVWVLRGIRPLKSSRPIICVGNILAGGVGKTPIVRAIATYMDSPVVMRGYKAGDETDGAGDEALMMARDGIQVHTGNRRANIRMLNNASDDTGPIIMDDGFQNPGIRKDISILVFDASLGCGNGFLLPAGPLREGRRAISRADAVIIIQGARRRQKKIKIPDGVPVFYAKNQTISPYGEGTRLVAFAGIGYPKKFFDALHGVVARRGFADHWQYTADDIEKLRVLARRKKAKLITTEKDWVRLPVEIRDEIKYAKLVTVIDNTFYDWLKEKLKCRH